MPLLPSPLATSLRSASFPPLALATVLIVIWHFSVSWLALPEYLFPAPLSVLAALNDGLVNGTLWPHIATTLAEIVIGYLVGCSLALVAAALVSEFDWVERAVYPLLICIQSVPKVALAPILLVWFGFEMQSKIIMVSLICFFPTFVNSFAGFRASDPNLLGMYRAFGAARWRTFFGVKLPGALGPIFAGLEISVVLALIGAVVAELVASRRGLGHVIVTSAAAFNVPMMFACVIVLALIGLGLSQIVRWGRRRLIFWEGARASAATVVI